ncbi:hypothetical protein [Streptomyces sp. NPDC051162]|uniref:hypothetical protein n=1 Tax=unclassified Streptomyces TaxID=2593676 RepID=UPI00343A379E
MVTIDELTKLDRSKFTKAAEAWSKVSNRASVAMGRVESQMLATLRGTQEGDAAKASLKQLTRLSKNYQYIHAECGLIRTALSGLAEELEGPQNKLKQALKDAADLKFTVNPDGSVNTRRQRQRRSRSSNSRRTPATCHCLGSRTPTRPRHRR